MFDVTMGCYDGAEGCELVGLYLLDKLSSLIEKSQTGLYRDDGLSVIHNANGPKLDKLRKEIIKIFKTEGLNITIETNLTTTDFLDVSFDLSTGKYYPFRKPIDKPLYINASSNHPPSIIMQIPKMISKRISDLSFDETEFKKAKNIYENALSSRGIDPTLTYEVDKQNRQDHAKLYGSIHLTTNK